MYEKRKAAALEIEKMVKDFVSVGNTSQIKKLLKVPQQIQKKNANTNKSTNTNENTNTNQEYKYN